MSLFGKEPIELTIDDGPYLADTPDGIATLNVPSASDYYQFNLPPRIGIAT